MTMPKDMTKTELERAYVTLDSIREANEKRLDEQARQIRKIEDELRPHREKAENEKRIAERDQKLTETLTRLEALVTKTVKDPALREMAFQYALYTTVPMGGFWR